ncbi:hypothetical protein [Ferribacterium limneticum]|uniref:hypothetical protein n=1 Tax=Ferribacterium limneticum TaxID=76259 RepID=UPI001CF8D070|nr:hypothetical protein [Ferribacterium limneticum]UCV26736.1 hypothetical protein KI617_10485 [Ferribacterium limneticum]UCV30653.1 hypothetical protein KI608_10485 [Ferribacterium limneticum]
MTDTSLVEKETTYRVCNTERKTVLLVKVDEAGYVTVEDYNASTKAPEFARLLRGLASAIEEDYPNLFPKVGAFVFQTSKADALALGKSILEQACPNHEPVV